ncbi:hypothetical protein RFN25_14310 [Mesorhizobium abyssinicae]|uniref:hypothetical protein n=1 Tax=Mesorhizobium TaxID=68287 RepID=UPI000FD51DB1|nr:MULTISPECIES: hypothetical protein [Mesorhizobium]RVC63412.1 hypothetical protein EN779_04980 [Mesorhizobium sp. M4B.F.Ca.ET.088.02.2.1]MDX8434601.1 hypothetical protein [Mesorhizobium abyssinicae]RWF34165.1 MAG: hypothetical protein EOS45_01405 [Mesorhizobium sp.]RWF42871.1 MAG: hypothetical protein EOS65_07355 [Mesorhizobium sp.]TIX13447.1 MAG: hypothetical protein E5V41_21290 [Mesorhizobium sp.]
MATINGNLVLDEQIGVQAPPDDDTDNDVLLDQDLSDALTALGVVGVSSPTDPATGFPQVAVNDALLDTTGVTDLALSIPDGDPTSGLFTVDGVEIFLYNEGGIIYGREADADGNADPNGDLAFAVVLDESDLSSAQIYLIQYEPLGHLNAGAIDDGDTLSFAQGKITLDVTTTELVTTFQTLDFASIPSGSPQETLTVATTDPTDNHSAKFDGIIFPTGVVDDPTTILKNSGTNDDLNPDAIGFGVKGGQASQMNQNEGFFVQDAAWTSGSPDENEIGGIRFDIQAIGGVKKVNIEWWAIDNGQIVATDTDTVNLPSGSAVFENYTIETADSVDQIYVRFTYDTKASTSGVRVENLEVAFPSSSEVTVVNHEDLGTHLVFEDAGPTFTGINGDVDTPFQVGLAAGQTDTGTFDLTPGADGSHVTITTYTDLGGTDITENLSDDGTTLTYHDELTGQNLYRLTVTDAGYTFNVLFTPQGEQSNLDFNAVKSGGPQEILTVPTVDHTGSIVFDGLIFNATPDADAEKGDFTAFNTAPLGGQTVAADDLNPDAVGFGVKSGQASQINNNEGFTFHTADGSDINNLTFAVAGIGNINTISVESWLYDDFGNLIDHNIDTVTGLRSGNQTVTINDDPGGQAFDTAYVQFHIDGANSGVRILDFSTSIEGPVPDQQFDFTLENTDLDGDAATQTLSILASQDFIV